MTEVHGKIPKPWTSSFGARTLLIGLLVAVALAVTHRTFLFLEPWHEHGDYAVNAMAIERARHFQEIHGNYSRFGFNHPGPAFYYVYALGEQVFHRWLHLVPSSYNAHALSGLGLQCLFFGAALAMADQWLRRPLFIPLALLTTTIHLSLAANAFIDTWPPRVLLMPFLCFAVGVASVAAGEIRHLPVAVLAGCFLVHGHVAQPLYVVPLFLIAYGVAWRQAAHRSGAGALFREHRTAHLVSAACIAVFLVPLAIDLRAGAESNLAQIIEFQTYDYPGKPLWKALLYFCAFFGYAKKTEIFLSVAGPDRAAAIGEHMAGYFVWGAIVIAAVVYARRMWLRPDAAERPFILSLTAFTVLSFPLSLYWGMVQVGRMYEYNGYFFYAILSCILLLLCAAISTVVLPKPGIFGAVLCAIAAWLAAQRPYVPLAIDPATNRIPTAVREALDFDPRPSAPKYLLFHREDWPEAVSIGLALRRAGHEFRADADWGPKFAPGGGFEPAPPQFDLRGVSVWRLSRHGPTNAGIPLRDNLRLYFEPLPFDPTGTVIDCGDQGDLELYNLFGFASPLGSAAWTIRPHAGLVFDSPTVSSPLSVTFFAEPFAPPGKTPSQLMTLRVNGVQVYTGTLQTRGSVTAHIPAEVWNTKKPVTLVLHIPGAVSPRDMRQSLDERKFGWHIERIAFEAIH